MRSNVLIVDEDASFREKVKRSLKRRATEAATVPEGLAKAKKLRSLSVIILGVRFAGRRCRWTGIDAIPAFRAAHPQAGVIVMDERYSDADAVHARNCGALTYLVKGNDDELRAVVQAAHQLVEADSGDGAEPSPTLH